MDITSRRGTTIGAVLVLAGLVAGCSAGPAVAAKNRPDTATTTSAAPTAPAAASTTPPSAAPSSPTAPAADTSTAPADTKLEGTSWAGADSDGDDYVYRFEPNGRFGYTSPNGTYDDPRDTWLQSGNQVRLSFTDGYAVYLGTVQGDTISGTASNVTGHTWTWTAQRQ